MRKKHFFYIIVLSAILSVTLIGSVLLSQAFGPKKTRVRFSPNVYVWEKPPQDPWRAYITIGRWRTCRINPDTILLEGTLAPEKTKKLWFVFVAYFDGNDVKEILESKLVHDGGLVPGKYEVELTISGNLIDETPFEGTGTVKVIVPK